MYIPNFGMKKSPREKNKNHSYPKLFETASLTYFRSEKKRKTSFSFAFLSLNRIFAAHYGDTCAFHANGVSSVERESGASPEQCPLL